MRACSQAHCRLLLKCAWCHPARVPPRYPSLGTTGLALPPAGPITSPTPQVWVPTLPAELPGPCTYRATGPRTVPAESPVPHCARGAAGPRTVPAEPPVPALRPQRGHCGLAGTLMARQMTERTRDWTGLLCSHAGSPTTVTSEQRAGPTSSCRHGTGKHLPDTSHRCGSGFRAHQDSPATPGSCAARPSVHCCCLTFSLLLRPVGQSHPPSSQASAGWPRAGCCWT